MNKVFGHWPLWGFCVAIIHRSEEHVPLFTPSLGRYTAPHFDLGLILQVTISYASIVHKATTCKYPKYVFVISGGIHNSISFQSRQGKCRCDFLALCCLQNGSHPVCCSFFVCLSEAWRWIFSFENVVASLWTRCTHILSLFPEASDSNLSGIAGCPVKSFVALQSYIVLVSDWKLTVETGISELFCLLGLFTKEKSLTWISRPSILSSVRLYVFHISENKPSQGFL